MADKTTEASFLNDFDTIDYKRPIGKGDDWRTSTSRAHCYLSDLNMRNNLPYKLTPSKAYEVDHMLERNRISDYKDNYLWPRHETGVLRNPILGFKQQFIKPFDERKLKFLKRPMRPLTSTAREDFQWRPEKIITSTPTPIKLPTPIEVTKISINRCAPGYAKYLDPSATTTRLDYCYTSPSNSIARHDNITFWNWSKISPTRNCVVRGADGTLCDTGASHECPKRRCEFPSLVKRVPHTGMTTEVRDNFSNPLARPNERVYDSSRIRNVKVHSDSLQSPSETDYRFLTSGERVQKYV